jgi:hypothetical protein
MHNPFSLHSEELLRSMLTAGRRYFVRQYYPRGIDHFHADLKAAFLLTHYNEQPRAQVHYEALSKDGYRKIYDARDDDDMDKLLMAVRQPSGYAVYAAVLSAPWRPSELTAEKVKRYVSAKLSWRPKKAEGVKVDLFTQFGELYVTLKSGGEEVKVPLSEIERI